MVAYLQNDPLKLLPSTIANAHVTSASTDFVTLDASLAADSVSADGKWIISPGFFYHHQWAYMADGLDLDVRRIFAGGDTVLRARVQRPLRLASTRSTGTAPPSTATTGSPTTSSWAGRRSSRRT